MAYGATVVKVQAAIHDIRVADYQMYFSMTMKALQAEPESIATMSNFTSVQHKDIVRKVLDFIDGSLPLHGTMGKPMSTSIPWVEHFEDALINAHLDTCAMAFPSVPWNQQHIIAHCNATYLTVLSWKSTGIPCEDQVGFVKLNGTHTQQWATFHSRRGMMLQ